MDDNLKDIIAAIVLVIPLFLVPAILKKSINSIPVIGEKLNGLGASLGGAFGKKGSEWHENSSFGRGQAIRKQARDQFRNKEFARKVEAGGFAGLMAKGPSGLGWTASQRAQRDAISRSTRGTAKTAEDAEITEAKAVIEHINLSGTEKQTLALTGMVKRTDANGNEKTYGGAIMQKAAIQEQMKGGSMAEIHQIVQNSGGSLSNFSQTIAQSVVSNGIAAKDPTLGGKTIDLISQGRIRSVTDLNNARIDTIKEGKISAESLTSMNDEARKQLIDAARTDATALASLKTQARVIRISPELSRKLGPEGMKQITDVSR